ncbi:NUDIX domain-containing protein [Microbacterium sp. NPDC077644]|uniref:NUDIX domain-containing protein n=1 Tax=Microbacterium sp. NPDC077644 TaxID=3155055 RepID=UPI00344F3D99
MALQREVREELGVDIRVGDSVATTSHTYEFAVVELSTYYSEVIGGKPIASEHSELRWCNANELKALAWAPADVPAVHRVVADLASL